MITYAYITVHLWISMDTSTVTNALRIVHPSNIQKKLVPCSSHPKASWLGAASPTFDPPVFESTLFTCEKTSQGFSALTSKVRDGSSNGWRAPIKNGAL